MAFDVQETGFGGVTEYLAPLSEKRLVLPRQLAVIGGGVLAFGALVTAALFFPALTPLFLILTLGCVFLLWFLWRYTQIEYEYVIAQGEMTFSVIYGKKSRRDVFSFPVKQAERIVSYQAEKDACDAFPADETRFYASSFSDADTLCALVTLEDGRKVRLFFRGTERAVSALRRANPGAVRVKKA